MGMRLPMADHGAGKSYLGFILYDLFFRPLGRGHIYGIESRPDLVERSCQLAERLGFARMSFLNLSVAQATESATLPASIDVVTALHACDTATDDAIAFGLQKKARAMAIVPCCQAEVASHLRRNKALQLARTPLAERSRIGVFSARHSSLSKKSRSMTFSPFVVLTASSLRRPRVVVQ